MIHYLHFEKVIMQYLLLYVGQKNCFVLTQSPREELEKWYPYFNNVARRYHFQNAINHFQLLNGRYSWNFKCTGSVSGTPRWLEIPIIFLNFSTLQFNRSAQHGHVHFSSLDLDPNLFIQDEGVKTIKPFILRPDANTKINFSG